MIKNINIFNFLKELAALSIVIAHSFNIYYRTYSDYNLKASNYKEY